MTSRGSAVALSLAGLALLAQTDVAIPDWPRSPFQFVRVGSTAGNYVAFYGSLHLTQPIAPDGQGGLIAVWPRGTSDHEDLVAQRLDSTAASEWGSGSVVSNAPRPQLYPTIVADGSGGAFAFWGDWRDTTGPDVYAQHVSAEGVSLWNPLGVPVCIADQPQAHLVASLDGQGGVFVAWEDSRGQWTGSSQDIYAQRLDAGGDALWGPNGRAVAAGPGFQGTPKLSPSGNGGTYVAWTGDDGVWIQRLDGGGAAIWQTPIQALDASAGTLVSLLLDGRGGVFVGSSSSRLQRVASDGTLLLQPHGMPIASGTSLDAGVEDGSGGTFWLFHAQGGRYFVTRVDSAGVPAWSNPVAIGSGFVRYEAVLVSDGSGGAIAAWIDTRSGGPQVYATRIDGTGHELWGQHGLAVHVGTARKDLLGGVSDGANGLIVVWDDHDAMEVRAQRVDAAGSILPFVPGAPRGVNVAPLTPNPSRAAVLIGFSLARSGHARVSVFDVGGRLIQRVLDADLEAGAHQYSWSGYGTDYRRVASGVYVVLIEALGRRVSKRIVMLGGPTYDPERPR